MTVLGRIRRLFVEPSTAIGEPEIRRRARWLSGLLLFIVGATFMGMAGEDSRMAALSGMLFVIFAIAYGLSRTRHYVPAVQMVLLGLFAQCASAMWLQASVIHTPGDALFAYVWLLIPVGVSGIWLSARGVIMAAFLGLLVMLVHSVWLAEIPAAELVALIGPSFTLLIMVSILFVAAAAARNQDMKSIQAQAKELRRAKSVAESASRAKSEFLANMSHELRTPMNAVQGMVSLLLDSDPSPEDRESLMIVKQSGDALMALINDILDYSKLEAEHVQTTITAFSLRRCVDSVVTDELRARAHAKQLELDIEWQPGVPEFVCSDRARLRQVLHNLIDNAIKFTESGTISLSVRARPVGNGTEPLYDSVNPDVTQRSSQWPLSQWSPSSWTTRCVDCDERARYELAIAVMDTGKGIDKSVQENIFELFQQGDTSMTRSHGGIGLGLAISRRLISLLGGRMWLDSEVGVGSTFHIMLPVTGVTAEAAERLSLETGRPSRAESDLQSAEDLEAPEPARLAILLVEDNPLNQRVALSMLQRLGYAADIAGDGQQALSAVHEHPYDVVLMDVQMPVMDGLEATRRIREDLDDSTQPYIVAVTAHTLQGDREQCLGAGMDEFLGKPFGLGDLERVLRHANMVHRPRVH